MSNFFNHLENFPTFYNLQSVSSNAVAQKLEWKELPADTPIPDCHEINITCFVLVGDTEIVYSNQFSTENITGKQNLVIGGYYVSSSDYGLCNVNAVNRVITKRNFIFDGINYLSQSSVKVRYR